jgi:hypothetical protein
MNEGGGVEGSDYSAVGWRNDCIQRDRGSLYNIQNEYFMYG